ncbi:toprim domain-containing protein [Methylocapsa palsarum]|uniref:toprim domain-containing protein n=1 Tax=Methylocapsa palsarum TaxID=1612308 RepID=UPI0015875C1A|nr:toprim domain-containing protein [Methylocapsa palsarum]
MTAEIMISEKAAAWAKGARRISAATLARLGVGSGTTYFPELDRRSEGLFFRYPNGWKARAIPDKAFVAGKGFKLSFWNIDRVIVANPPRVYIVEGEFDALALVEAGVSPDAVLSVPNGAKERPADAPQDQAGYAYVDEAMRAGLSRAKQFVWCGDGDGPGLALRTDMARLLGAARFSFVDWPEGCKDANDLLAGDGPEALRSLVEDGALPWPVAGLYRMRELPEPAPFTLWKPGFPEWESKVMLAPRTLSVVTGHPGHGKTALWAQIWFKVVQTYGVGICVASFETRPKPHLRRQLRTLHAGGLEKDLTEREIAAADAWINDRYLFVVHPEQKPTLEWFLDMAEVAVVRHGARIIQVDPWNRLEGARERNESETDYIGRCLRNNPRLRARHELPCADSCSSRKNGLNPPRFSAEPRGYFGFEALGQHGGSRIRGASAGDIRRRLPQDGSGPLPSRGTVRRAGIPV